MKIAPFLIVAFAPALLSGCEMPTAAATAKNPIKQETSLSSSPVVVELFQSQGCFSCPPANAALNAIADRKDVIALSFSVTYWDRLGWKDTFADPAYTKRQYDYAGTLGHGEVYTPQVILNGSRAIVGNGPGELNRAVAVSKPRTNGPMISAKAGSVTIGSGIGRGDVLLVRYDPRTQHVAIRSGENGGRTLPHRNIVRQVLRLGDWAGKSAVYRIPNSPDRAWQSVILVQSKRTGPILAAGKI